VELRANQMSLGDLTNDTARDATDFATEIGGGHNGLPRIPPCERQLLQDYVITGGPPGGSGTRSLLKWRISGAVSGIRTRGLAARCLNPLC
jgi:hypothetical protein